MARADKGDLQAGLLQSVGVELVVDVDDENVGIFGAFEHGDERLGVRRRDDERLHALRDHLIDQRDLLGEIGFVFDAVDDEFVVGGVLGLMLLRAFGHRLEEFIG